MMRGWLVASLLALGCHPSPAPRDLQVRVVANAETPDITTWAGHTVQLDEVEIRFEKLVLLGPGEVIALRFPLLADARAHGDEPGLAVAELGAGVVTLDTGAELGSIQVTAEALAGAELHLAADTTIAGTVDGLPFDVALGESHSVAVSGGASLAASGSVVEVSVDLPSLLAHLITEDENADGVLDAGDTAFTNTLRFGLSSTASYALRPPSTARAAVLAHSGRVAEGAEVFAEACASCHGAAGEGGSAPALEDHVRGRPRADTVDTVLEGAGSMAPLPSLTPTALADCTAWLHRP